MTTPANDNKALCNKETEALIAKLLVSKEEGTLEQAALLAEKYTDEYPMASVGHELYGRILMLQDHPLLAALCLERALELNEALGYIYHPMIGFAYQELDAHTAEALEHYEKGVAAQIQKGIFDESDMCMAIYTLEEFTNSAVVEDKLLKRAHQYLSIATTLLASKDYKKRMKEYGMEASIIAEPLELIDLLIQLYCRDSLEMLSIWKEESCKDTLSSLSSATDVAYTYQSTLMVLELYKHKLSLLKGKDDPHPKTIKLLKAVMETQKLCLGQLGMSLESWKDNMKWVEPLYSQCPDDKE